LIVALCAGSEYCGKGLFWPAAKAIRIAPGPFRKSKELLILISLTVSALAVCLPDLYF
jgi:hypothetical protein